MTTAQFIIVSWLVAGLWWATIAAAFNLGRDGDSGWSLMLIFPFCATIVVLFYTVGVLIGGIPS